MRLLLFILGGAVLAAWYIRWRTLIARARWRHESAARYARWSHTDDGHADEEQQVQRARGGPAATPRLQEQR